MKHSIKHTIAFLIVAVSLAGCQKPKDATRVSTGGAARSGGVTPGATTLSNGLKLNGQVKQDVSQQADFQLGVQDLLEAQVPRDYVGVVMADGSGNTGVWLGGKVELANGQRFGANNGSVQISATSELYVSVFDSYYTTQNLDPIPGIYLRQSSGTVNGNRADLTFWDGYGKIELDGFFDGNTFQGDFKYKTDRTYDGQAGWSGTLGHFSVPTCQFFRCN